MKGRYNKDSRRVFTNSGYKITIGVIIAVAIALVMLLLVFLPVVDDTIVEERTIVSIVNPSGEIGVGDDLSKIYCTVYYSDGTYDEVMLTDMIYEGLDVGTAGAQNVSLNYGGFEQTITLNVKEVDCVLKYEASIGGRIQGEATQGVANGSDAATVIAIPETGYTFTEWNDGYPYATRKDTAVHDNATYIAEFEKATYTVRFYYLNGTVAVEEQVAYGEAPTKVPSAEDDPNMQIYGYTFSNWIPTDFSSIDRDMVIRPEYLKTATDVDVIIPEDIYGNSMGSTDLNDYGYYEYGESATITATPYNSRMFAYWMILNSSGEYERLDCEGSGDYTVGSLSANTNFTSTKLGTNKYIISFAASSAINKITIKAIFAYEESTISFVNNQSTDGNISYLLYYGNAIGTMIDDENFFVEDKGPGEVIGLKFIGWFTEGTDTEVTAESTFEQPTSIIAKWEKRIYTVRFYFEADGSPLYDKKIYVQYQNTLASGTTDELGTTICGVPTEIPVKEHFIFVGWQNSITLDTIDDKTKVTVDEDYLDINGDATGDFADRIITMTPIFEPVKHKLTVSVTGAGAVNMTIKEGSASTSPTSTAEQINGVVEIREDYQYTITFEALEGYALSSVLWTDSDTSNTYNYTNNEDNVTMSLNVLSDNDIIVIFSNKKFDINILIDESVGSITYLEAVLSGTGTQIDFEVDYNASVNLLIGTVNREYVVENIMLDGQYLVYDNGDYKGADEVEYTLTLEKIRADTVIEINYKSNNHSITTPVLSSGNIVLTSIYNPTVTSAIANSVNEYVHDTENVYRITAPVNGYYIQSIKINGYAYDLYNSGKSSIVYFNWFINSIDSEITVLEINEAYYYYYGDFTIGSKNYIYCQTVNSEDSSVTETAVFEVSTIGGSNTYTKITDTAIIANGYQTLSIASRDIYSTSITKDNRITSIDLLLTVDKNYAIEVVFAQMTYTVSVESNASGTASITNSTVAYNGTSTVTVTPKTGYYIDGYTINGGSQVTITRTSLTASYSIRFVNEGTDNRIREDKSIVIIYKKIQLAINFKNTTSQSYRAYVDGVLLNSSINVVLDYKCSEVYEITIDDGLYCISSVKINGVAQEVHYNMTSYTLSIENITAAVAVEIICALKTNNISTAPSTYTLGASESNIQNVTYSAQYITGDTTASNELLIMAEAGYYISSVLLTGDQSNTLSQIYSNVTIAYLTIPSGTFANGESVNLIVVSSLKQYTITTTVVGSEDLDFVKTQTYGTQVSIVLREVANHYISSFKIDGEEISFDSSNWTERARNSITKEYISGTYLLTVTNDTGIYLEYSLNVFNVTLDTNSINGTTILNSYNTTTNIVKSDIKTIQYGERLLINLSSNTGYHIKSLYINNVLMTDLALPSAVDNNNTGMSYTYLNIASNIVVKVIYEINRYSFTYAIENISQNFASYDSASGTLTTESNILADGDEYTGIEYGRNFYINAIPSTLNGYYLVSIYIEYKGNILTIPAGDNKLISYKGGMIYFNTMLDFNEGITQDIDLIKLTFDKYTYDIELNQSSVENTGTLTLSYTHPNSSTNAVVLFGDNSQLYYYLPQSGEICTKVGSTYIATDLALNFFSEEGRYYYTDSNDVIYNIKVEHGIRYTVKATPTLGYQRTSFVLNGNELNSAVNNNAYSINIVRNTAISVTFEILTFTVDFSLLVADKNLTGRMADNLVATYATISIVDVTNQYSPQTYTLGTNTSLLEKVFTYGTKIKLVMTPKFSTTGYYLYNMYYKDREINSFDGDVTGTITYGGADGITLTGDITAIANFRIIRYSVTTNIQYTENIVGESANTLINESSNTIAWGDSAIIKVASGSGYELNEIYVQRGSGNLAYVTMTPTDEQLLNDLQKYIANDNSATNGIRNIIKIEAIKSNITVNAKFARKEYTVRINFTNLNYLYIPNFDNTLDMSLNVINTTYPYTETVNGDWNGSTYIMPVRYYDELSGILTPKNGYKISDIVLKIYAVIWNEASQSFIKLKDSSGNYIEYYLSFTTVSEDILSFTFHKESSVIAELKVESDLMIDLTCNIKMYSVVTTVNRNSTDDEEINDTSVYMNVKTKEGQLVRVNGTTQAQQTLTPSYIGTNYTAEHHGYIVYDLNPPVGYMLTRLEINGLVLSGSSLRTASYTNSYMTIVATQLTDGSYSYKITINVIDSLIAGSGNYTDKTKITVSIYVGLINYEIITLINDVEYDNHTDGKTITVVTANTVNHYEYLNIAPTISEGYKVTSMTMSAMNSGVLTDMGYTFNISQSNTLLISNTNLKYVNVLTDNLIIYICYSTEIKKYSVDIFAYAYSIDMWSDKTEGVVANSSAAGELSVSALTNGVRTNNISTVYNHEYFSVITNIAYANSEYVLYIIQEYTGTSKTGDWLTSDNNWTEIKDGVRGISYSVVNKTNGTVEHTFEYTVNSYGDRTFRIVYRQQTTVTINVINPYRFYNTISGNAAVSNMNYIYYPEIIAKISNVELDNMYDIGTSKVVDTYIYKVNVGSVMSLSFYDNGTATTSTFGIYYIAENNQYVQNTAITTTAGFEIRAQWDFYLKATTKLYVTYEKETNGASTTASGGEIYFGLDGGDVVSNESSKYPTYSKATVMQTVTILAVPYENYIFTELKVRQIDQTASKLAGKIVYKTGTAEWLTYNASNFASLDSNGFIITQTTTATGYICYTITMTGNMELSFVFYKTYNVSYTASYSDTGTQNTITMTGNTVYDNLCSSISEVSYNSYFTLVAPTPDSDLYQFVGWYVNGVNIYKYLSTRYPDSNRLTNRFEINGTSMTLTNNNAELDDIVIIALYQRIINVSIINELYYYDTATTHWNSWTTGGIRSQYYDYVSTQGLPVSATIENINNRTASTIATVTGASNATYNSINSVIGTAGSTDTAWNTLSTVPAAFDKNTLQVYSASTFFKVLYQNITDEDYINNTWQNGSIELMLVGMPNTVRLQAWQYYNWITGAYEDINYTYEDPSGLTDSLGNDIIIDSTNSEYIFNLGYIYSGNMSGAISTSGGVARPLIIRPFLRKVVAIDLSKMTYIDQLGGNVEYNFSSLIAPSIDRTNITFATTNNFYNLGEPYEYTSDDSAYGEYDYGTKLDIRSYCNVDTNTGLAVYTDNEGNKYRFLGWFLNWTVNSTANYRYVLDLEGTNNLADESYSIYLTYNFGEEPPQDDTIQYRAVYINQYEQDLYSYNVAGGYTYENASNNGQYAYKDAPAIDFDSLAITSGSVTFASFNINATGNARAGFSSLDYGYDIISEVTDTHKLQFYIDIGCDYTFDLDFTQVGNVAGYVSNNGSTAYSGYDPNYDNQYSVIFSNDATKTATYANKLAVNSYAFGGANASNSIDKTINVSGDLQIDIQYTTKVKLVFNNIMWYAGITLPTNLSNQLTANTNNALTVWDLYSSLSNGYGDVSTSPDGTVVICFNLDTSTYTNYWGEFKYTPYGYKDGQGITTLKKLTYYLDNNTAYVDTFRSTNNQTLFNPNVVEYRRHIVINFDQTLSPYIDGGTLLFGDSAYTGTGGKYSTANTGNGSSSTPYKIYTAQQLKNINVFWYYNEYSCVNTTGTATNFRLYANINLQSLDVASSATPYIKANATVTKAWIPLCYQSTSGVSYGFDGVLDGAGAYTIYGLAASGISGGNIENGTLEHEEYDYTFGYGIFGLVKGGTISNLNIGNAYIDVSSLSSIGMGSASCSNVGVLAGSIVNSTITNVTFKEYVAIGRYNFQGIIYRIFINAGTADNGVGALAGYVQNSVITGITMDMYQSAVSTAWCDIGIMGENAGVLIGNITDNNNYTESSMSSITITSTNYKTGTESTPLQHPILRINSSVECDVSGGIIGYMNASNAIISNIRFNTNNYIVVVIGNSGTQYSGGVIGKLVAGTIKNTVYRSHAKSVFEVGTTGTADPLNAGSSGYGVGGIAGYNAGIITNLDIANSTDKTSVYGTFYLYGAQAGGIAGVNLGEIIGFQLNIGSEDMIIHAPYTKKNFFVVSGSKGGIVGYNYFGALVDECSFGNNSTAISDFMYVYDKNSDEGYEYNSTLGFSTYNKSDTYVYIQGNLYVGGIAGATLGAIYNSYIVKKTMTVKYYNAIVNAQYLWNIYIGGIAGAQPFEDDANAGSSYTPNLNTLEDHPNIFSNLDYEMFDWTQYDLATRNVIMAASLAIRCKIQSCYTSQMTINLYGSIWCENSKYKRADETSFVGSEQNISVGGIVGYNNTTAGTSSINNCYSYGDSFIIQLGAYGNSTSSTEENKNEIGWYETDPYGIFGDSVYYLNRAGTKMSVNVRGIVAGRQGGIDAVANYCWTYNCTINDTISTTGTNRTGETSFSNKDKRGIEYNDTVYPLATSNTAGYRYGDAVSTIEGDVIKYIGGKLSINGDKYKSDNVTYTELATAGFVGWYESMDSRIYRTDPETGMLMVWHSDLSNAGNINIVQWYTEALSVKWFALDGEHMSDGYAAAVADTVFMTKYLVGGEQVNRY